MKDKTLIELKGEAKAKDIKRFGLIEASMRYRENGKEEKV